MEVIVYAAPLFVLALALMVVSIIAVYPLIAPEVKSDYVVQYPIGHSAPTRNDE